MTVKKMMMTVAAATVAAWCSWGAESISVDKVANHYPWDGKVDCVVTLGGVEASCTYKGVFTLSVEKAGATIRRVVTNDLGKVAGTYTNTFDCTALFGAGYYPNGGISVVLVKKKLGGVQLWENGPYFAECNVGATKPEEYGYYFWWGDTVGYKRNSTDDGWESSKDGTAFSFSSDNVPTCNKTVDQLTADGYIDSMTNLVAKYDAASAHLSEPWRMPTTEEIQALVEKCTTTWTNNWNGTGVNGRLVTGTDAYASKSIFLPAPGYGDGSNCNSPDYYAGVWASTPHSSDSNRAWSFVFFSNYYFRLSNDYRHRGQTVRPVRSAK